MVSTARIERPPLYRGGSASIETIPATSLSSSQTARCTSTECQQPPIFPLTPTSYLQRSGQFVLHWTHRGTIRHRIAPSKLACYLSRDGG